MRDLVELCVTQVRIYPSDCIPIMHLKMRENARKIRETFAFEKAQTDPVPVTFENGKFEYEGKHILISSVSIDARRIVLKVMGSSSAADALNAQLVGLLEGMDQDLKRNICDPVVETQETSCVVTLDVDFDRLMSPRLYRFLQRFVHERAGSKYANPVIFGLRRVSFEIRYQPVDTALLENGITLTEKPITIEPRAGTAFRDRRYFTSSPTDSETHIRMLRDLEKELRTKRSEGAS